jgi:purine-binding chemotaxis protein CheW
MAQNSYLTFKLAEEYFAVNVINVMHILEMMKITKVPHCPDYMMGVINLRGAVVPVIDTKKKFGQGEAVITQNTCILVLNLELDGEAITIGALVDSVHEVEEISENQIKPAPSVGSRYKSDFIEGLHAMDDKFIMIVNMNKVLSMDELLVVQDIATEDKL